MAEAVIAIGGVIGAVGSFRQVKAAEKAENLRKRQMNLEAMRQKRQIIREGVRARAVALSSATAQGGAEGSGLQGGYGQIAGQVNNNMLATNQDQQLGNKMFKTNAQYAKAGGLIAIGQGVSAIGSAIDNASQKGYSFGS